MKGSEPFPMEERKEKGLKGLREYPFLIIGLFLLFIGLVLRNGAIASIGILAAITEGLRRVGGVLRKEQVVDNWSILIGNAQGRAEEIFNDTDSFLEASRAPGLKRERREATLWEGQYRAHLADLARLEKIIKEMESKHVQEDRSRSGGTSRRNRTSACYTKNYPWRK